MLEIYQQTIEKPLVSKVGLHNGKKTKLQFFQEKKIKV